MDVTITRAEYLRLLRASLTLAELEDAGVDNWPGRDYVDWNQIEEAMDVADAGLPA